MNRKEKKREVTVTTKERKKSSGVCVFRALFG
jgi:hypothetical protein